MAPILNRVVRLDSLPLNQTFFTEEGYLIDRPILTSTGIFEYKNRDGSIRRELRLPEEVFDAESLKSYKGKPVIITHSAGLVTKDNVERHCIGTILTEGYRTGEDVRAEIVIHDTDSMKASGLKELSLGYDLDLDETPGEWNGEPYDAIQRNIRINHLALVGDARAGKQARLNIDSRDEENILQGGKIDMAKRINTDSVLSQEELAEAIKQYKERRAAVISAKADGEGEGEVKPTEEPVKSTTPAGVVTDGDDEPEGTIEEKVQQIKEDNDSEDEPKSVEDAKGIISRQDENMNILFDIIDTLLAERDFKSTKADSEGEPESDTKTPDNTDGCGKKDGEDETEKVEKPNMDDESVVEKKDESSKIANMDAADFDRKVRERVKLGIIGRQLNLDGLEDMNVRDAKIAVISAIKPGMRFDGKSATYVDAAFDMAVAEQKARSTKDTRYQARQMFNNDSKEPVGKTRSANDARMEMINRRLNKKEEK